MSQSVAPRIKAQGIHKSYGAVRALRDGNLEISAGETHALVGENGAGKSTIIKILSGAIQRDGGNLSIDGTEYHPANPQAALQLGIGTVYQDPQIVKTMTVAENIMLGRFPTNSLGSVQRGKMVDASKNILHSLEISLNPNSICKDLSVADQQLLQVARAASFQTMKLLVLDEPTSSLTPGEVRHLFGLVERLKARGVSILFVSHKLGEVYQHADSVTVFRDGRFVTAYKRGKYTIDRLVADMVGRDLHEGVPKSMPHPGETPAISVSRLSGNGFREVSFDIYRGEIFGLFGLVGAGRTNVLRALFGADPIHSGSISLGGRTFRPKTVQAAIAQGLAMVPEDRKGQGLIGHLSVNENLNLATYAQNSVAGVLRWQTLGRTTAEFIRKLSIKTSGPNAPVSSLSGGNQQKVVIARWLASKPVVLMLDEPAAGIDIGAKSEIYRLMEELATQGMTILVVSSELPEILRLCHRVGVMKEGQLVAVIPHEEANEENLLSLATLGAHEPAYAEAS